MENFPIELIVHHDGVSRTGPSFDIINEFHKSKGFPLSTLGFYVGYHYWIERDGTLRQARAEYEIGAHTVGENLRSIGIGLAGDFDVELPTDAQVQTLGTLLTSLSWKYQIAATHIFPHRRFATKTCYGSRLCDTWAAEVCLKQQISILTAQLTALLSSSSESHATA